MTTHEVIVGAELVHASGPALHNKRSEALETLNSMLMKRTTEKGKEVIIDNAYNLSLVLTKHPDVQDCFGFNDFNGYPYLMAPILGGINCEGPDDFEPRLLRDTDYTAVQRWVQFSVSGFEKTSLQGITKAVDEACEARRFDLLRDWVERCAENWDKQYRTQELFAEYFVADEQTKYSDELGEIAMMCLVLRALDPGAAQRVVPVLQGAQGIGKSRGLAALCPQDEWFTDELKNIGSKDTQDIIRLKFLVELGEMAVSKKTDRDALKAFLTRTHETFREAYGRRTQVFPRRCMFWGTTNEDSYLRDTTGNTRFQPIKIVSVNVEAITRDRDQLIGEAVHLLREYWAKKQDWWEMSPEALALLEKAREGAEDADPWLPIIAAFVDSLDEVCAGMIMDERGPTSKTERGVASSGRPGLNIPNAQRTSYHARRISGILQKLGWRPDGLTPHNSAHPRVKRFVPPTKETS
jgi:predicted P-loop ATPase